MAEIDRSIRRLTALEQSASTARVLNLMTVHRKYRDDPELAQQPLFKNRLLDHAIILKHRLRPHEYADFSTPRPTVTKILLPIDGTDLKAGAHTFFIGQRDFDSLAEEAFGQDMRPGAHDRLVLEVIDSLPSLDPFLLRESLRSAGFEAARAYFAISEADVQRMYDFVRQEITALVALSAGENQGVQAHASKLVEKLLSNSPEGSFEPLKLTLKLSDQEYQDGIFSWRGFLYYKWVLSDLSAPVRQVITELREVRGRGQFDAEAAAYIPEAKQRLQAAIVKAISRVQGMLDQYNNAYAALTQDGKPGAFREFLLSAPKMFMSLGEQLGAVQHIVSFWRYRFPQGERRLVTYSELMDILLDFEDGLVSQDANVRIA